MIIENLITWNLFLIQYNLSPTIDKSNGEDVDGGAEEEVDVHGRRRHKDGHGREDRGGGEQEHSGGLGRELRDGAPQPEPDDVGSQHQHNMPSTSTSTYVPSVVTTSANDVYRPAPEEQMCLHLSHHDIAESDVINPGMCSTNIGSAVVRPSVGRSHDDNDWLIPMFDDAHVTFISEGFEVEPVLRTCFRPI